MSTRLIWHYKLFIIPGRLVTGDCNKNIHVWNLQEAGTWHVDQRPYTGHSSSVEDIQWSPTEPNVGIDLYNKCTKNGGR